MWYSLLCKSILICLHTQANKGNAYIFGFTQEYALNLYISNVLKPEIRGYIVI